MIPYSNTKYPSILNILSLLSMILSNYHFLISGYISFKKMNALLLITNWIYQCVKESTLSGYAFYGEILNVIPRLTSKTFKPFKLQKRNYLSKL